MHCPSVATTEPQLYSVAHVVWTCRVPHLPIHNYACCACYEGLLCCRSHVDRTHVDTLCAEACTRVEYGVLFKPLKSHRRATFINNFV
jgi:hypothetical protein